MPRPSSPPYVENSKTIPRLLQRWLDVNAQNGPLTRTRKYLTFPSFSILTNYQGYSNIIGEYLYSSPKKFSLRYTVNDLPLFPNYTLCISCIVNGVVKRYRIFAGLEENILFDVPNYNSETIEQHFKFEIWSGNVATCVQTSDVTFFTSMLGDVDYRYGNDSLLTSNMALCKGQNASINPNTGLFDLPLIWGNCTQEYGATDSIVVLGNQIKQIISNETGNPISIG